MHTAAACLGVLLILAVLYDMLRTTVMSRGVGPLSSWLASALWRAANIYYSSGTDQEDADRVPPQVGTTILLFVIVSWIVLIWTGWTLFFNGSAHALINAQTKAPASFGERIYFTGYSLFTLGLGDFQPKGLLWQMATTLTALTGLFVVTFSITYVIPVLQAAVHRRSVAIYLSGLGRSPGEIILNAWDDDDGAVSLEPHLTALAPEIALLAQRHLTYPVLHYFHGPDRREALAPNLAALDEALTVLENAFDDSGITPSAWRPVRTAISEFLETMGERFIDPHEEPPGAPDLSVLQSHRLPLRSEARFQEALAPHALRRRLLIAHVEQEGWNWQAVYTADDASDDDNVP